MKTLTLIMVVVFVMVMQLITAAYCATHEFHHPQQFVDSIKDKKNSGQLVYQQFCQLCHAAEPTVNVGAPVIGKRKDWQLRMKKGINAMLAAIDNGMNAMPPRGGCFECSDEQLKAAIRYMLPKSKQ